MLLNPQTVTIEKGVLTRRGGEYGLVAWRSGYALCPINEVALRRAGLVLGWVTACVTSRLGQLRLSSFGDR